MDEGIAACRAEMTVGHETKEIWLQRSMDLDPPPPRYVTFGNAVYEVRFDADRRPLGFELKLEDFEVGFEPGTEQPTKFESQVELTDPVSGNQGRAAYDLHESPARIIAVLRSISRVTCRILTPRRSSPLADSSRSSRSPPIPAGR